MCFQFFNCIFIFKATYELNLLITLSEICLNAATSLHATSGGYCCFSNQSYAFSPSSFMLSFEVECRDASAAYLKYVGLHLACLLSLLVALIQI